ncbi:hypothetical protein RhiJN_16424 [Ceratobasidium sp. AG-Ba]|nr:hypothetical protein RhiJN_16424 [Ceratobasidium sp. AG-Ba]
MRWDQPLPGILSIPGLVSLDRSRTTFGRFYRRDTRISNRSDGLCDLNVATFEVFQGLPLPVPWDDVDADFRSGAERFVELHRLPAGMTRFDHPVRWPADMVTLFAAWLRQCQSWIECNDTEHLDSVFQWREPENNDHTRLFPYDDEADLYDQDSANFYIASMHRRLPSDAYLTSSIEHRVFGPKVFEEIRETWSSQSELLDLAYAVEWYERYAPPKCTATGHEHKLFQWAAFPPGCLLTLSDIYELPPPFYVWEHKDHEEWLLQSFTHWVLHSGELYDRTTGLLCGGNAGIAQVLVVVLLVHVCIRDLRLGVNKLYPGTLQNYDDWEKQLRLIIERLFDGLNSSVCVIWPALRPGNRTTPWTANQVEWTNCAGGAGRDEPLDTRSVGRREWVAWIKELDREPRNDVIDIDTSDEFCIE